MRCGARLINQAGTLESAFFFRLCPTLPAPALQTTTKPTDSLLIARKHGASSVLFAMTSLGFRYGLAMVSLWNAGFFPPPYPLISTVHLARLALQPSRLYGHCRGGNGYGIGVEQMSPSVCQPTQALGPLSPPEHSAQGFGRARAAYEPGQHKHSYHVGKYLDELHRDGLSAPEAYSLEPNLHRLGKAK